MKKAVKMLATGALSVLSLGLWLFSSCEWKWLQKEDSVYYGEEIAHTDWIMKTYFELPEGEGLFRSVEELQRLWTENGYPTFESIEGENPTDGSEVDHRKLYQKMHSYDEAFFEEKALIFEAFMEGSAYGKMYVKTVAVEDEERLNMVIAYEGDYRLDDSLSGLPVCVYWGCFIEVDRNDVEKVTVLDLIKK